MLWVKAFHVIFMVTWFSGLFYLPRLFVYHTLSFDEPSIARFKVMEFKLFWGIMTPGAILTLFFGAWLLSYGFANYLSQKWLLAKLVFVVLTCIYHMYLGRIMVDFKQNRNRHTALFYRWLNEVPVLFLVSIIILVIVKPWGLL